jgi:hypothetical protein
MPQLEVAFPANVCDNAGTLEQQDTTRTFIIGPNIALPDGFSEIQPVWGITAKELLKLGRNVLLQPEDGSIPAPPNRPTALLTNEAGGKKIIVFYALSVEIRYSDDQEGFKYDRKKAAAFFKRHAKAAPATSQ